MKYLVRVAARHFFMYVYTLQFKVIKVVQACQHNYLENATKW